MVSSVRRKIRPAYRGKKRMQLLELRDIHYTYQSQYQSVEALKGIDYTFESGLVHAIIGKSGSGKTTLLSLMAGLDLPTSGEVICMGESTAKTDLERYRREKVAVIYQSFRLFPLLTAAENVAYPMELRGERGKAVLEKAREMLRHVSLPDTVADRFPGMLSGGEQQRVAIARALTMDTKLLLADEPTGNLDTENGDRIVEILTKLAHEQGYCVVIATHDPAIRDRMDVVLRITDGTLTVEKE